MTTNQGVGSSNLPRCAISPKSINGLVGVVRVTRSVAFALGLAGDYISRLFWTCSRHLLRNHVLNLCVNHSLYCVNHFQYCVNHCVKFYMLGIGVNLSARAIHSFSRVFDIIAGTKLLNLAGNALHFTHSDPSGGIYAIFSSRRLVSKINF